MEEQDQSSWKGHGFTLVVFAGLVVLCAIFFVLGMTVGHQQGQRAAQATANGSAAKLAASEARAQSETDKAELSSYAGVETDKTATLVPAPEPKKVEPPARPVVPVVQADPPPTPAAKAAAKAAPAPSVVPPPATPAVKSIYWQVDALGKVTAATKEVDELRKKGFSSILVDPSGTSKLYSVRVGPFSNAADAEMAKAKLVALGYKPIKK